MFQNPKITIRSNTPFGTSGHSHTITAVFTADNGVSKKNKTTIYCNQRKIKLFGGSPTELNIHNWGSDSRATQDDYSYPGISYHARHNDAESKLGSFGFDTGHIFGSGIRFGYGGGTKYLPASRYYAANIRIPINVAVEQPPPPPVIALPRCNANKPFIVYKERSGHSHPTAYQPQIINDLGANLTKSVNYQVQGLRTRANWNDWANCIGREPRDRIVPAICRDDPAPVPPAPCVDGDPARLIPSGTCIPDIPNPQIKTFFRHPEENRGDKLDYTFGEYEMTTPIFKKIIHAIDTHGHKLDTATAEIDGPYKAHISFQYNSDNTKGLDSPIASVTSGLMKLNSAKIRKTFSDASTHYTHEAIFELTLSNVKVTSYNPVSEENLSPVSFSGASSAKILQYSMNSPRLSEDDIIVFNWSYDWSLSVQEKIKVPDWQQTWKEERMSDDDSTKHSPGNLTGGTWTPLTNAIASPIRKFQGSASNCTRTMVTKKPVCTVESLIFKGSDGVAGTTDDGKHAITGKAFHFNETAENDSNGRRNQKSVFPVGKGHEYTQLNIQNENQLLKIHNDGSTFSISSTSGGTAYYNPYPTIIGGGNSALGVISGGSAGSFPELSPHSIPLPGSWQTEWSPKWSTIGKNDFKGAPTSVAFNKNKEWKGREFSGPCKNPSPYLNYFYIYADPPTCGVSKRVFERGQGFNLEIGLTNLNAVPMDIDSAYLNVEHSPRHGSAVAAREDAIYINGQQLTAAVDRPVDLSLPEYGVSLPSQIPKGDTEHIKVKIHGLDHSLYDYSWHINTSMGRERWTTLSSPDPPFSHNISGQQWSWFEFQSADPNKEFIQRATLPVTPPTPPPVTVCDHELRIVIRPYFKALEGDISVGGYFGWGLGEDIEGCDATGNILPSHSVPPVKSHLVSHNTQNYSLGSDKIPKGSSAQYGLQVKNEIAGVYSGALIDKIDRLTGLQNNVAYNHVGYQSPQPFLKDLTLGDIASSDWGGASGQAQSTCLPNYWNIEDLEASDPPLESRQKELGGGGPPVIVTGLNLAQASSSPFTAPAAPQDYMQKKDIYYYIGDLELTNEHAGVKGDYVDHDAGPWGVSATSSYDGLPYRKVIYVEGDLEIKDNIKTNLSGFIDPQNSDYVYLIVRGDIYIHPEVERLDAVLVAYPKEHSSSTPTSPDFKKGRIYTCQRNTGIPIDATNHHTECKKQLVINGALVAKSVHLGRVYETLWWQGRSKALGPPPLYMPLVNRANWPSELLRLEGATRVDDYNKPGDTFIYDRLTCDNKPPSRAPRSDCLNNKHFLPLSNNRIITVASPYKRGSTLSDPHGTIDNVRICLIGETPSSTPAPGGCVDIQGTCSGDGISSGQFCIDNNGNPNASPITNGGTNCIGFGDYVDHKNALNPHMHPAAFPYDHDNDFSTSEICSHASEDECWHNLCKPPLGPNIYRNNASESIQLLPEFYAATPILPTPTSEKYKVDARYTVPLNF